MCFPSPFPAHGGALSRLWLPAQPVPHAAVESRTSIEPTGSARAGPAAAHCRWPQQHSSWQDRDLQSQHPTFGKSVLQKHVPSQFQLTALHPPIPGRTAQISKASLSLSLSSQPFYLSSYTWSASPTIPPLSFGPVSVVINQFLVPRPELPVLFRSLEL